MSSVEEVDSLAECLYANPDRSARQQAQERLSTLTHENADVAPLRAIFGQSSNQYALLFAAQGVVTWFKANSKWLSEEQRYEVVVQMCGGCVQRVSLAGAPRHVVLALMNAYAKLTKLCFEKGNFLIDAATFALQMLHDTSLAYSRHVSQNGGCGTVGPAESNALSGIGGGCGSSGSTPLPAGSSSSGAGVTVTVGYSLINRSRLPHMALNSDDERSRMYYIALVLLTTLVNEFSKYDSSKQQTYMNFSTHRRCSNNFRDECLLDIFTAAIAELEEVNYASATTTEVLELVKDVMTFDFMAITVDETEEALSAQFPSTWKEVLLAPRTQQILWGQHAALPFPFCETLLVALTSLCGVRRTFFESTDDRVHYLDGTLGYLVNTMQLTDGRLKVPSYVSELGEACYRLVAPFGYRDLHLSSAFQPFINGVRAVSLDVFRIPFGQPGSFTTATTLLNFWSRLATSRRTFSLSEDSPKDLELFSSDLVVCFFESRMQGSSSSGSSSSRGGQGPSNGGGDNTTSGGGGNAVEYAMEDDEDFEATMDSILAQTEAIGNLAVLDHARTMKLLADYVNHTLGPSVLNSASATAWLFYLAAGLVRHVLSAVEEPAVEPCSMFFVFCVDCANHRRSSGGAVVGSPLSSPFVERALLHFLTMTQSVLSSSRLHEALSTVVTNVFQSRTALFQFILSNTGHNILRGVNGSHDGESAQIIRESIELIRNACMDVPSSMLAELHLELPPVVELPLAQSPQTYKLRTNLYAMLWRLSSSTPYSTDALVAFLQPIELCIQSTLSGGGGNDALYTAGWMRDLRGVVLSLRDIADGLSDFVEWVCDRASSFHECLNRPAAQSSMVIVSFLRFLEELVTHIGGRYTLPCCTAHNSCGLLLFRHICTLMQSVIERCVTDEHIQRVTSQGSGEMADGAYEMMLKPLALSFSVLRKCIQGGFVPLGAMYYYSDDTYDNMLLGMLRMMGVFPFIYFKEYSKVSYAVVNMLRTVTEEFAFLPLTKLDAGELEKVISFVVYLCEDVDTQTGTLLHGLSFLSFIAGLIREVKALSTQAVSPAMDARTRGMSGTPPPSPMQLPSFYANPSGRLSGTPGSIGGRSGGGAGGRSAGPNPPRSTRLAREALARTLEPFSSLWERLISVAMNVIVCQDRALSVSCAVVYPIFETHPPFWFSFVENFVRTYPDRKQNTVREALSTLSHAAESQDKFFSEVFTFRQAMRNL
ncbi:hypothetical protein ABB37_09450 [Leptomonas pyrrhocoris]|uniref:Importin N-terminal domain-containing protein n=1 Tax=Leptomonas pyrrhocoris TaxID=157538 RepID=A0A0M9FQY8_LEPPY|nr:hypothetical protein ABB37_09450 [Leptomonas pyrrhocoris]KPA74193.1 hypothetical protein ABB37_09450 [Leptomonas pyrrhocoris]|eukprot:XP_015652632.1 hypothetical protein ABB37_09450 [Leptomonas pyrrhocoris]